MAAVVGEELLEKTAAKGSKFGNLKLKRADIAKKLGSSDNKTSNKLETMQKLSLYKYSDE